MRSCNAQPLVLRWVEKRLSTAAAHARSPKCNGRKGRHARARPVLNTCSSLPFVGKRHIIRGREQALRVERLPPPSLALQGGRKRAPSAFTQLH